MTSVIISMDPRSCGQIAQREKSIILKKTKPAADAPIRCYIYCTKDPKMFFWTGPRYAYTDDHSHNLFDKCGNGQIIGEFVCQKFNYIEADIDVFGERHLYNTAFLERGLHMSDNALFEYLYCGQDKSNGGWCWHISNLVIYTTPKTLTNLAQEKDCKTIPTPKNWVYLKKEEENQ